MTVITEVHHESVS